MQDQRIRVYDTDVSTSQITKLLIAHEIEIEEIQKYNSTLEDYFYHQIQERNESDMLKLIELEWKKLDRKKVIGEAITYWIILMFLPVLFLKVVLPICQ